MSDDDEHFARVEEDLLNLLREEYGLPQPDLSCVSQDPEATEERARRAIASILSAEAQSQSRDTGPGLQPRLRVPSTWPLARLATGMAVAVAVVGFGVWLTNPVTDAPKRDVGTVQATPPLLDPSAPEENPRLDTSPVDAVLLKLSQTALKPSAQASWGGNVVEVAVWKQPDAPTNSVVPTVEQTYHDDSGDVWRRAKLGPALSPSGMLVLDSGDGGFSPEVPLAGTGYPPKIPADPAEARDALLASCGHERAPAACLIDAIAHLGRTRVLAPHHNALLLRTLIGMDGIEHRGTVQDRTGRDSAVFAVRRGGGEQLLLIDVETGVYAGDETIKMASSSSAPDAEARVVAFHAVIRRFTH